MRKRTARQLRRIADRLDPKPARWYQVTGATTTASAWQQSGITSRSYATMYTWIPGAKPRHRHRVLADYLSSGDIKRLRP